jgi:cytochrome bd-type quinol oxidase subunit 2
VGKDQPMSKYLLLVLINVPLLLIGIVGAITSYKTKRISQRRCAAEIIFWLSVGAGVVFVEPLYNSLIRHNLTDSPPMSLFDIVLLTVVLLCLILIKQTNEKTTQLQKKFSRLHENLVIADEERSRK